VLEALGAMYPGAPIFTLLHVPGSVSSQIEAHPIHTSFLQRMPLARTRSARRAPDAYHVCYCFTPMRYLWDLHDDYFGPGRAGLPTRIAARLAIPRLRRWDVATAARVDDYVAISRTIADRIARVYGRQSAVIEPPVDTDFFTPGPPAAGGADLLVVSALVPYKRVDLVVEAMRGRPERLRVVGRGPELSRLRRLAPPNVTFLGDLRDVELRDEYRRCRALVHAAVEDFGIAPIEALACGRPVVGLGKGALTETVEPGLTGLLFSEQTPSSLVASLDKLAQISFNPDTLREAARRFSRQRFRERFEAFVSQRLQERKSKQDRD
jgi:glycosyltransferase involved in cell wall biosynthesis